MTCHICHPSSSLITPHEWTHVNFTHFSEEDLTSSDNIARRSMKVWWISGGSQESSFYLLTWPLQREDLQSVKQSLDPKLFKSMYYWLHLYPLIQGSAIFLRQQATFKIYYSGQAAKSQGITTLCSSNFIKIIRQQH